MTNTATVAVPSFVRDMLGYYSAGVASCFFLEGNVHDFLPWGADSTTVKQALALILAQTGQFDVIAEIDPTTGISFPAQGAGRQIAQEFLWPESQANATPSPFAGFGGQPQQQAQENPFAIRDEKTLVSIANQLLTEPIILQDGEQERQARVAIIISNPEYLLPTGEMAIVDREVLGPVASWGRNIHISNAGHLAIMLASDASMVHGAITSSRWQVLKVPYPTLQERENHVHWLLQNDDFEAMEWLDIDARGVAAMTGALGLRDVEDILYLGRQQKALTRTLVGKRKQQLIEQAFDRAVSVENPATNFSAVGGYQYLTGYLRKHLVGPWHEKGTLKFLDLLLTGPPGTGKTVLAGALAGELGVPIMYFDIGKVLSKWQGESEQRMNLILEALLAQAPCILFIDEIDTAMGSSREDSGSRSAMFGKLLQFMTSEQRRQAQVLIIAATNRPESLDEALRSRFNRMAPMLPPSEEDRAAIFQLLVTQEFGEAVSDEVAVEVASATQWYVGRNMKGLVALMGDILEDGHSLEEAARMAVAKHGIEVTEAQEMTWNALEMSKGDLRLVDPQWMEELNRKKARSEASARTEAAPVVRKRR